jgi:hypothetical protein
MSDMTKALSIKSSMKNAQRFCQNLPEWESKSNGIMDILKKRAADEGLEIVEVLKAILHDPSITRMKQMWFTACAAEILEPSS